MMRILTLWEPWATLMALGEKRIETRSWSTRYRGPLAIHAAKGGMRDEQFMEICRQPFFRESLACRKLYPGHIVAVVDLHDCKPSYDIWIFLTEKEKAFGDYATWRYGWVTNGVFRLPEPIPYKGSQGLGIVPADVVEKIKAQGWRG